MCLQNKKKLIQRVFMFYPQNAIAFEEKEEQRFSRDLFKSCFTELSKIIQEVSELKAKDSSEEVRIRKL